MDHMNNDNSNRSDQEPTIRFTIDPQLLQKADDAAKKKLEDTYRGAPLLPPEPQEQPPSVPDPQCKAPRRRWVLAGALLALAVAICLGALALAKAGTTPDRAAEIFLTALDQQDVEGLRQAVDFGEGMPTDDQLWPLMELWQADDDFRQQLSSELVGGQESGLIGLEEHKSGLSRSWQVAVHRTQVRVQTNLPGANVALGDAVALTDEDGAVVFDQVLPGSYTVSGSYETPYGTAFTAETTLDVKGDKADCQLDFFFTTLEIYNSGPDTVAIDVEGIPVGLLESQSTMILSPIEPQALVQASHQGPGPTQDVLTIRAEEGYFYVSFALCQVEIYNEYPTDMEIFLQGSHHSRLAQGDLVLLENLPAGWEITATLPEIAGLAPFRYQTSYDFDYLYPNFALMETEFEALVLAVTGQFPGVVVLGYEDLTVEEDSTLRLLAQLEAVADDQEDAPPVLLPAQRRDGIWSITLAPLEDVQPQP